MDERSTKDVGTMLKTILLPLDGSSLAERALAYATVLARRCEARVVLVEAVQAHTLPGVDPSEAQIEVTSGAEAYLKHASGRLSADGIVTETHVYYNDPVHAILDAATRQRADLIVMSTHGRGGLSRMLYGSVADQILRRATIPVLLVPSIVEHAWPADGPLSLLVPLDGSELATEALHSADLLTEAFGARLTLLRVVQSVPYPLYGDGYAYVPYDEDAEVADARRYLDDQAARLTEAGVRVRTNVAVGDPARVIGEVAREQDVDVVVMATHGHGGLSRVILGSVATATLRHTTAPLLLVRPTAVHAAEPVGPSPGGEGAARRPGASTSAPAGRASDSSVTVQLTATELELIEHSLKALGHAPGYDYSHVLEARALADRLKRSAHVEMGGPVAAR
jgi:nucleotide-binding universal stress UspA family protein